MTRGRVVTERLHGNLLKACILPESGTGLATARDRFPGTGREKRPLTV